MTDKATWEGWIGKDDDINEVLEWESTTWVNGGESLEISNHIIVSSIKGDKDDWPGHSWPPRKVRVIVEEME